MRWTALTALAILTLSTGANGQDDNPDSHNAGPPKLVKTPTQLPKATAEPAEGQYAAPLRHQGEGPSDADVGPVQKLFVRASKTDTLAQTQVDDNASLATHERFALDKRISVPLIHDVQNDGVTKGDNNNALQFELDYLNYGAITESQRHARYGHYFTITWKNSGPPADFVTRFEYREVKSQEIVRTLTQPMRHISGAARSYFAVTDQAYLTYGPVVSWRFTVLRADTVVAEAKSFIW